MKYIHDDQDCRITTLACSEDEKLVAFGDEGGHIKLFDVDKMTIVRSMKSLGSSIKGLLIDRQLNLIVTYNHNIIIFDKTGVQITSFSKDKKHGEIVHLRNLEN